MARGRRKPVPPHFQAAPLRISLILDTFAQCCGALCGLRPRNRPTKTKMEFTARQIAEYLGGELEGDADERVSSFARIEEGVPGALTFLYSSQYEHYLYETEASAALVPAGFRPARPVKAALIRVADPRGAVARLMSLYEKAKPRRSGVSPQAFVAESARIGGGCYIGPFAFVGENAVIGGGAQIYPNVTIEEDVRIGSGTIVYPNVSVYRGCVIGSGVILHSGCVIGADGFGFAPSGGGYEKIPQIGNVVIEDNVEIGANTCVDRATMGSTVVRRGVKLDNLVQIAHNDEIGANTVISAQTGVAGSTKVGEWCMFGGQVGVAGHSEIAGRTRAGAQAGIAGNVRKEGATIQGSPAIDAKRFARASAVFKNLPEIFRQINEMQRALDRLTQGAPGDGKDTPDIPC